MYMEREPQTLAGKSHCVVLKFPVTWEVKVHTETYLMTFWEKAQKSTFLQAL